MGQRSGSARADAGGEAARVEELSFEAAMERLEAVVQRLEEGELELEEALAAFEEGVALTRRCAGRLDDVERRIETLVRDGEGWLTQPFEPSEEPE